MITNPTVSIVSPCYNDSAYLKRFFESVLSQTYTNIELIFINDGSTDETEQLAKQYEPRLAARGIRLVYIYQENGGLAASMNTGLKCFTGDFFTWVDVDDVMMPDNIKEKVDFLQSHPECGFVFCEAVCVSENDLSKVTKRLRRVKPEGEDTLFDDFIRGENVVFGPGTILVRKSALKKAVPAMQIYDDRHGQNWQILLPLSYTSKCGYIEKPLIKIVERADSHSRAKRTLEDELKRLDSFITICCTTIDTVPGMSREEAERYKNRIRAVHTKNKLYAVCKKGRFMAASGYRKALRELGEPAGALCYVIPVQINRVYRACRKRLCKKR